MSISSTTWWRSKWNTPSNTWRFCTVWGMSLPQLDAQLCHIIASGMFQRHLRDRRPRYAQGSRPCAMWISCGFLHCRVAGS